MTQKDYRIETGDVSIAELGQEAEDAWNTLTTKQKAIVAAYCRTGSASAAYVEVTGYSGGSKVAGQMGRKVTALPKSKVVIDAWRKVSADRFGVSPDKIVRKYAHLAFADIRDFFDDKGHLKAVKDLPQECADMIAGFDVETESKMVPKGDGSEEKVVQQTVTTKIRLINRKDSLDSLAKTQGMFAVIDNSRKPEAKVVKMPEKPTTAKEWHEKNAPKTPLN